MKRPDPAALVSAPLRDLGGVDVTAPAFKADPFPFYARLRREAPVFPVIVRRRRAFLVTRYDDVAAVLKDPDTFVKDPRSAMTPQQLARAPRVPSLFKALERNLLGVDGADHARLRALVHQAFTARRVEQMRGATQEATDAALDRAIAAREVDLVAGFALPVPLSVIGAILGVPPADHARFSRWMRAFVAIGAGGSPILAVPHLLLFMRYLRGLIQARRRRPEEDLVSALVLAQEGSSRLSDDETLAMVFLLLSAGHETTVNLIAGGVLALLQSPAELARLRAEPALLRSAVEELVRYVVPAEMATERYARHDVTLAGTLIPKGELVLAVLGSANRDAAHFSDPERLDVARQDNRHLSFGQGLHHCLGASLSRMEGQIAIGTLIRRAPRLRLRLLPEALRWRGGIIVRGLEALPVSL